MKYGYKEIRKISAMSLRELCIEKGWYTGGTVEEYCNLLSMTERENITTDDIVEIATDIIEHSTLHTDETFTSVMWAIGDKCISYFEEA